MPERPWLVVIGGPTGSGKSDLALALAARHGGVIISADSRQVYREFDIGTAKPTAAEQAAVPHRLLDVRDPTEQLTVAQYRDLATAAIDEAVASGRMPFLVGGTGLYLRAVVGHWVIPPVAPDALRRERLEAAGDLHARLAQVDPEAAARLHPHDTVRVVRALEVFEATGVPISQWQRTRRDPPYRVVYLALDVPRDMLDRRIDARVHRMLEAGLLGEVERLVQRYGADLPLLGTLGYAELVPVVTMSAGGRTLADAVTLVQLHTRRFAKRQRTWFAREPVDAWIPAADPEAMLEWSERRLGEALGAPFRPGG